MQVSIKSFNVDMEVRNSGIEFEVRAPDGSHLGDLVLTKSNLEWCNGRTRAGNGVSATWKDFIAWMNHHSAD